VLVSVLSIVAVVWTQAPQADTGLRSSSIADVVIDPAQPVVAAGDTLRLRARAVDSAGQSLANATFRFTKAGSDPARRDELPPEVMRYDAVAARSTMTFEAMVDSTGLVSAGFTGMLPVSVIALQPGARPFIRRVEVRIVPGPAASIVLGPTLSSLVAGQRLLLNARAYSARGDERNDRIAWSSSAPQVLRIGDDGLATAIRPGRATITAAAGQTRAALRIQVRRNEIASVTLTPGVVQARQGDVVHFKATARAHDGRPLTGLTPAWTFSPGPGMIEPSGAFVAYEPGDYRVSADFGVVAGSATVHVEHRDVRRPVDVVAHLLGRDATRPLYTMEEWIHPGGKYIYVSGGLGNATYVAVDISDPTKPVTTDSLVDPESRATNDLMSTPDGKFLIHTREGSSARRNGIAIASIEDPAHPKWITEFTEGLTSGVHSAFVSRDPKYGTHVYATNDATGRLHIINIDDPYHPREVARWEVPYPAAGRLLHDVYVRDGLAYLSCWNDGLVILDVGAGLKGGSPSHPQLVSQYKYDLNELYRNVEAVGGPGFVRGTHTAWREGRYVFLGDEVLPGSRPRNTSFGGLSRGGWYGRLQVIDVSDIEHPRLSAWYEPEIGGVHNFSVAGDTLYLGAYDGGFHAFDVSGELLGDLWAQGREIAHMMTADTAGWVKNFPEAWGAYYRDGYVYVSDMFSGLWILRVEPKSRLQ
jgi:hypothetical protein